jgi:hypothetical protein
MPVLRGGLFPLQRVRAAACGEAASDWLIMVLAEERGGDVDAGTHGLSAIGTS